MTNLIQDKTIEKGLYKKVIIGLLLTVTSVFISVAINDFPEISISGPFVWFNPDKYPIPSIFVIGLMVTVITAILQIEVEIRYYAMSSIINGYSFSETITNFILAKSGPVEEVSHNMLASKGQELFYFASQIPENNSYIESNSILYIVNVLTFIAIVSVLLNLIILIIKSKSKNRRVKINLLSENLKCNKNFEIEKILEQQIFDDSNEDLEENQENQNENY